MKKLLILPLLFLSFAHAETFQCIVVGVTDGDTITCLTDEKKQVKVRLYQIDAPESGQAYGQKAKQALSDMIYGETLFVENKGVDRYKRILGVASLPKLYGCCYYDEERKEELCTTCDDSIDDVNIALIQQGYARYYPFTKKNPAYQQAEQEAKKAKRGLWADKHAVAPWERRKEKK